MGTEAIREAVERLAAEAGRLYRLSETTGDEIGIAYHAGEMDALLRVLALIEDDNLPWGALEL